LLKAVTKSKVLVTTIGTNQRNFRDAIVPSIRRERIAKLQ
jgi:hypothetical protein